ncbi:hypothetical protein CHL76_02205 [Marinococcus halophilus]|uniref:Phage protein n=1 Tax=Marinococcus halophilus TaxID=1371 RepID=A0A510Y1C8_MARHA|nr:minor capsid protein [Marinococcus halophilus]OZT81189.1 hypothetical protein CHL76_02205 [Marinococcus halophilus]GEK57122.1 hypothetical protein MHA01_00270 [Marinococcus halophilus]
MKVMDVIQHLQDVKPFDYYANDFPHSAGNCAFVRFNEGGAPNAYLLELANPNLQIAVRHKRGSEAERISYDIFDYLNGKFHFEMGDTYVYSMLAQQSEPIYVGTDDNGRTIYSLNIACKVRR